MPDRVRSRRRRCASAVADPTQRSHRRIPGDGTADDGTRVGATPGVRPQLTRADGMSDGIDRDSAGPLAGARHGHDVLDRHDSRVDGSPGGIADQVPPEGRILGGPSVGGVIGGDGEVLEGGDGTGQRHQAHLGPTGAEVDGEDPAVLAPAAPGRHHRWEDPERCRPLPGSGRSGIVGDRLLRIHHLTHHHADEVVGLVGHASSYASIDGP